MSSAATNIKKSIKNLLPDSKNNYRDVRAFFVLAALVTAGLGFSLLVTPAALTNIFLDNPIPQSGLFFIRFAGTSLLGFSLLNIYAAGNDAHLLRLASWINLASLAPATFIAIWTYQYNYIDSYEWLIVVEHALFFSGFMYCLFKLKTVR